MILRKEQYYLSNGIWIIRSCDLKGRIIVPTVSVIMGVYNCKNKNLLKKSVDSIINQTFQDWEFLICNDGSTDDTLKFLENLELKDDRITILTYPENHGLNYALNMCLEKAKGQYIARQDDDDQSNLLRLEKQVSFLNTHNQYAIVGVLADVYDNDGIWGEYKVPEKPVKESFYWNSPFMHPTVMIRREAYEACKGYRVAKETRRCEDIDLFMRMYALGYRGYNIQEKLYLYRLLNNSKKKYRPMIYRIDEAIVRYKGYKEMGILAGGLLYIIKPILIGLIPQKILYLIKKTRY